MVNSNLLPLFWQAAKGWRSFNFGYENRAECDSLKWIKKDLRISLTKILMAGQNMERGLYEVP